MAQFIVRNLEDDVKKRLKQRAARRGLSMEEEVRQILRNAVNDEAVPVALGSRIAARFNGLGFTADLPELRGEEVREARFRKR